jgi:uncharacterized protein
MILPDVNLLLYAVFDATPEHRAAARWWTSVLNGPEEVALVAPALFGFIRIATSPRVYADPLGLEEAVAQVEEWLGRPQVRVLVPGPRYLSLAFGLLRASGAGGNLTTDAQLAAYALENSATLYSNDTDFLRFAGLKVVNPL